MLYKQIYNSTLGVIFFGTPHQGSSTANYATTITRNLLILANKPNAELLESLRTGSPVLKQLDDDWKTHHERRPYEIASFYETRTMKGLRGLVSFTYLRYRERLELKCTTDCRKDFSTIDTSQRSTYLRRTDSRRRNTYGHVSICNTERQDLQGCCPEDQTDTTGM
jgi:hypothetical protein